MMHAQNREIWTSFSVVTVVTLIRAVCMYFVDYLPQYNFLLSLDYGRTCFMIIISNTQTWKEFNLGVLETLYHLIKYFDVLLGRIIDSYFF